METKYVLVIEHGPLNLSAYFPDFPGCVTAGHTLAEILDMAKEAIDLHLEDEESPLPTPRTVEELAANPEEVRDSAAVCFALISVGHRPLPASAAAITN